MTYKNDLPDGLSGLTRLFADDTSNDHQSNNEEQLVDATNRAFSVINTLDDNWLVKFNPYKTEKLIFGASDAKKHSLQFMFDNSVISHLAIHKHLGIIFTDNGKWTVHIDNITVKAYKQFDVLRKLKYTLTRKLLSNMYITFIRPAMEYASEVWDNLTHFDGDTLEKFEVEAAQHAL